MALVLSVRPLPTAPYAVTLVIGSGRGGGWLAPGPGDPLLEGVAVGLAAGELELGDLRLPWCGVAVAPGALDG